ncbi:hypothetical protein ILYODFUR_030039 [Ilyodon furcidens]|uniref:Uncharacterized protein n=1 Tax=Ilyodon furcidens TaxID=33524 RepID=A0ABV0V793_9TELE
MIHLRFLHQPPATVSCYEASVILDPHSSLNVQAKGPHQVGNQRSGPVGRISSSVSLAGSQGDWFNSHWVRGRVHPGHVTCSSQVGGTFMEEDQKKLHDSFEYYHI